MYCANAEQRLRADGTAILQDFMRRLFLGKTCDANYLDSTHQAPISEASES